MKPTMIWANLTTKDPHRAAAFYTRLGFTPNMQRTTDELASFKFGDAGFVIHFFHEEKSIFDMHGPITDLTKSNEVMFTLSASTEEEVNNWAMRAEEAGGTIFQEAGRDKEGYYVCGFADPDGHKFNVLLMEAGM